MGGKENNIRTLEGDELRARIEPLGLSYVAAAERLGLSEDGLYKQLSGQRKVSRQTEIILEYLEGKRRPIAKSARVEKPRRARSLAKHLY
jgi:hypothetical protein